MNIKIEIDVEPEELRRFLGLPDVMAIPEDAARYLRDKIVHNLENLDSNPLAQTIRRSRPWQKLIEIANTITTELAPPEEAPQPRSKSRRRSKQA
ncbi:MAG: DUF6489 family protein [Acidobacteria bacterium]|nr:DUF6489 family protein [Acidobacteriota bacterium]